MEQEARMAEQNVLRMGDPRLLRVADPVAFPAPPDLPTLIRDLWDTMAARGGVGIAAPQIGVGLRVIVFGMECSERYPEAPPVPRTVLVNPRIEVLDESLVEGWEGCLSVPGLRGLVPRYASIRYRGFDADGSPVERETEGFHARVVQHECDHLEGILYPRRVRDLVNFGFEAEISVALGEPGSGTED